MARQTKKPTKREIDAYMHTDKERVNNPPVGLVTPDTDKDLGKKEYAYDPHIDPTLNWAGKAEHTSFDVPTVSLHVHERIDSKSIINQVKKKNGGGQPDLFTWSDEVRPLRESIEFYKHKNNWTNRLIAGDSLLVMNSLLEKEGMAGQVQMVYMDPPYGIKYGSNFQPFTNNRTVKDGKDEDMTAEPEMIRAFRDTWELGIHSYLTYMRDRLLLARELLHESGSCFIQIGDENIHLVRTLLDEIFGIENFVSQITFTTSVPLGASYIPGVCNYLLFYAKDKSKLKFRRLFQDKKAGEGAYTSLMLPDGSWRSMKKDEKSGRNPLPDGSKVFFNLSLLSAGRTESCVFPVEFNGKTYNPGAGKSWKTNKEGMENLIKAGRIIGTKSTLRYVLYHEDYPVKELTDVWTDTGNESNKVYVVQTSPEVVQRCLLMATDPGDLVIDPTCGSGTTAYTAEKWGRRWITTDTSRVATALAKQRLLTQAFDYYHLSQPNEGIGSGFKYKTAPHVTLKSIATKDTSSAEEVLYDQPLVDRSKARVAGPFTVEAVPSPVVKPIDDIDVEPIADASVVRSGETARQYDWQEELLKTGIRGKNGQSIEFSRVETLPGCYYLHADGETKEDQQRVAIAFGPDHAPLEQRQVELAIEEAQKLVPKPKIIVFAAFQFDPEAAKDIDETNWPGDTLLKAQMNADLLTDDLKKKRSSNESFWLIGQPDVTASKVEDNQWQVEVLGFDYFNTKSGTIDSGGEERIAMWMLDPDYDGRSLFPRQVFFPMAGAKEGWAKLAKNLKAEIDEDLIEAYRGTISLPFEAGEHGRAAVKIIDDRGIESLKIINLKS